MEAYRARENSANVIYIFSEVETNVRIFSTIDRHHIKSVEVSVEQYGLEDAIIFRELFRESYSYGCIHLSSLVFL
jgi:hypothetical protein